MLCKIIHYKPVFTSWLSHQSGGSRGGGSRGGALARRLSRRRLSQRGSRKEALADCGAAGIFIFGAKLNCAGFLADPKLILILVRAQLGGGLLTAGAG